MEENLPISKNYSQQKMLYMSDRNCEIVSRKLVEEEKHHNTSSNINSNVFAHLDKVVEGNYLEDNCTSSLQVSVLEVPQQNRNILPTIQELNSPVNEMSSEGSSQYHYEDTDDCTSDDDCGGDFTVSKYMQSKLSRLDEKRFGVWRVERRDSQTDIAESVESSSCVDRSTGSWEIAGSSHSAVGLPSLKLTLKKSLQSNEPEEQLPLKEKVTKKKYKTKHIASEQKNPEKRRGPGRPPSTNPQSVSARQRLMNLFKKKYFKDRKRWARTKSSCSMPPTIRSIAKP